jgi:hypothetical protein
LQLSSIAQVCGSSLPYPSTVEDLYIDDEYSQSVWDDDGIENTLWLELLLPFTAVKNLYLSKEIAPSIAVALQELVGARITEVLPSLQNIFVRKPQGEELERLQENLWQFAGARRQSGHPVTISDWNDLIWNQMFGIQNKEEEEEETASSCKHSTLVCIGFEADIVVCTQRRNCGRNRLIFWVYMSLVFLLYIGPQVSPPRQEKCQGPKRCVDLNQYLCLNDWLAIYSTVMMSLVRLRFCSITRGARVPPGPS